MDPLIQYLMAGKDPSSVANLAPGFAARLAPFLAAAPGRITINSGYRSVDRQAELWAQALAKYGSPEAARKWVAPPGKSNHNHGGAVDLGYASPEVQAWALANAAKYGLNFRLGNEPWHVELAGGAAPQTVAATPPNSPGPAPGGLGSMLAAALPQPAPQGNPALPFASQPSQGAPVTSQLVQGQDPRLLAALLDEMQMASARASQVG